MKVWKTIESDQAIAAEMARELGVPNPAARALYGMGLRGVDAVRRFLNPRLADLSDPFVMPGMRSAAERIWLAVERNESIAIYGDYDVDGITSTALLFSVLKKLGARRVACFLPNRLSDGYGLGLESLERMIRQCDPGLLITVDCGTSADEAIRAAAAASVDVIVTDHHEADHPTDGAFAVLNPKLGDIERLKTLAGVGVVFKLCHALIKLGRTDKKRRAADLDLRCYLEWVLLGTVADIVPLLDENRILARHGLSRINGPGTSVGMRALKKTAGVDGNLDAYHVAFLLAPRLNAAGRISSPESSLDLLLTDDPERALEIALRLDRANSERQELEARIKKEAESEIDSWFDPRQHFGIVVGRKGWHAGVIGIVASRLSASYRRPVVVIAFDEKGAGRGSCRSIEECSLLPALKKCSEHLVGFGGHAMAAGLDIQAAGFKGFRAAFNDAVADELRGKDLRRVQPVNAWIDLRDADEELLSCLDAFAPFGHGNPKPVFASRAISLADAPRKIGKKHLRLTLVSNGCRRDAIAFGMAGRELPKGPMDAAYCLQRPFRATNGAPELVIQDVRPSEGG